STRKENVNDRTKNQRERRHGCCSEAGESLSGVRENQRNAPNRRAPGWRASGNREGNQGCRSSKRSGASRGGPGGSQACGQARGTQAVCRPLRAEESRGNGKNRA